MAKRTLPKIEVKKASYKFRCTYSPTSVVQGGFQYERRIEDDLRQFRNASTQSPLFSRPRGKCVGFDTEYDAAGALLTVGIADSKRAIALETTEKGWKKKLSPIIKKAKVICGHSLGGDLDYLVRLGLAKDKWLAGIDVRDSFLLARMYDENGGKGAYGLETLLLSHFNFSEWKAETEKLIKKTGNAADWSPEQRLARCRLDAWATTVLADYFGAKLK